MIVYIDRTKDEYMRFIDRTAAKLKEVRTYWNKPPEGKYMTFKEILAYSVGGFGAYSIFLIAQTLLLSTTNVIIGNTIGIQPMHMYVMYLVSVVANIPLTMIRAHMVDNVRYKTGKYRPYLLRMGVPTVAISVLFVFTPYASMAYIWRCLLIFAYNFGLQFFYNFFYDAYENLIYVLSPNSQERTNVTAVKSVVYSFAPTVINFVTPLIAGKVAGGNIYDLRVYQWLYPIMSAIGVAMVVLVYAGTREKLIVPKTQPMKVKFMDALREVAKNKYFWIISLAGWLGFLETCTYVIMQWLYNYAHLCSAAEYSFINLFKGTAYLWGMVLAPFAIKRWGKKKVLLATNLLNVVFLAMVYPLMGSIWTVLMCVYFNSIADSFILILNPAIQADIRDYQQYKSGERIDGMFGAVALIGSFVTMATSSVLPAVYEKYGIFEGNGYANMYDVLYDLPTLYKLMGVLVVLSAVGAALNTVPYFFYDLTEVRQKAIIRILKIRAGVEDYFGGALSEEEFASVIAIVHQAEAAVKEGPVDAKALRQTHPNRKERKAARTRNEEYAISQLVLSELDRFESEDARARLDFARRMVEEGADGAMRFSPSELTVAKAMPKGTKAERAARREVIADARLGMRSRKAITRYYPNGLVAFDQARLDALYAEVNALIEEKARLLRESAPKSEIKAVSIRIQEVEAAIKAANVEYRHYRESVRLYDVCAKQLAEAEHYARFRALCAAQA